jgi:hypothetical protein
MKEEPNSDSLDFRRMYFSLRDDSIETFYRSFCERSWFFPIGKCLPEFSLDDPVVVKV